MKVGFIGLSHLGTIYSIASAAKGFETIAYDDDYGLIRDLQSGIFRVSEPQLQETHQSSKDSIRYTTELSDLSACDVIFFSLDVKTDDNNVSDLEPLKALVESAVQEIGTKPTWVILSQVHPGFTRPYINELRQIHGSDVSVFYQVETLVFGDAIERALKPERYIVGCHESGQVLPAEYQQWLDRFDCPVLVMRYESAELCKISINFFLVSTVTTTNTLAEVCEHTGADWEEIAPALRLDRRIGPYAYLKPGLGISGGNLERDLMTVMSLSEQHDTDHGVIDAWHWNSSYRKTWPLRVFRESCRNIKPGARLGVLGVAYKENTHSVKNSPSVEFLRGVSKFKVKAYDPRADIPGLGLNHVDPVSSIQEACEDADVILILTPWPEFKEVDAKDLVEWMSGHQIVDPYRILGDSNERLTVYQLGKSQRKSSC